MWRRVWASGYITLPIRNHIKTNQLFDCLIREPLTHSVRNSSISEQDVELAKKMSKLNQKFKRSVEIALALQPSLATGRCFHITTVFEKNKLIAIGANNYNKTHPKALLYRKKEIWSDYMPNIHSELSAILKVGKEDCSDFLFFNIRIDKNREVNNSCPCSGCIGLMKQVGFKRLFYSNSLGGYEEMTLT